MPTDAFYTSPEWRELREHVLARDSHACVLRRFLGGVCYGPLHVHHIEPRSERPDLELDEDNCVTACAGHHPTLEAFRRYVARVRRPLPPCSHRHPYREGKLACARRRAREAGIVLDEQELLEAIAA